MIGGDLYDPANIDWENLPLSTSRGKKRIGYCRIPNQYGSGVGTFLKTLMKRVRPGASRIGRTIAQEGMDTAALIGEDYMEGMELTSSIKKRSKKSAKRLLRKALKSMPIERKGLNDESGTDVEDEEETSPQKFQKGSGDSIILKKMKEEYGVNRRERRARKTDFEGMI
jgi:hypothetical protein